MKTKKKYSIIQKYPKSYMPCVYNIIFFGKQENTTDKVKRTSNLFEKQILIHLFMQLVQKILKKHSDFPKFGRPHFYENQNFLLTFEKLFPTNRLFSS